MNEVEEFAPGASPNGILGFEFSPDHGYLFTVDRPEEARRLEPFLLNTLREQLARAGCLLVVITKAAVRARTDGIDEYVVSLVRLAGAVELAPASLPQRDGDAVLGEPDMGDVGKAPPGAAAS
jgi:hypothetical protein